jgi:hypothetical protein
VDAEFLDWFISTVYDIKADNVPRDFQLIFCGDFVQLPPVPDKQGSLHTPGHLENCIRAARRKDNQESLEEAGAKDPAVNDRNRENGGWLDMSKNTPFGMRETTGKFAFQSIAWRDANLTVHHLQRVHRTKEAKLLDALTDLRAGLSSTPSIRTLVAETQRPLPRREGIDATTLYPKKRNVQIENIAKLQLLDVNTAHRYIAFDTVDISADAPSWVDERSLRDNTFFKDDCQAVKQLELRLGAQVIIL